MSKSFNERLQKCIARGDLTVMDLKNWFDRPYATVRTWAVLGYAPQGPGDKAALKRLATLEVAIREKRLPLSRFTERRGRPATIRKLRNDIDRRSASVPPRHTAG